LSFHGDMSASSESFHDLYDYFIEAYRADLEILRWYMSLSQLYGYFMLFSLSQLYSYFVLISLSEL